MKASELEKLNAQVARVCSSARSEFDAQLDAAKSEIADLKRQLEEAKDLAKRCSDWGEERRQSALDACEMAMQRKEENEALRQQLTESQARIKELENELKTNT